MGELERDTESRQQAALEKLRGIVEKAWETSIDEHTTRVWGSLLGEQARSFEVDWDIYGGMDLRHSCGFKYAWDSRPVGVDHILAAVFDHLLVCPDFNR